ncbi:uncharacterized protein H6S33_012768 [Morchella sextelata]|uniref:uncharacterized protein n=1 Tax=Morchella sextelata TaxID=1174677 RepID=UPI001D04B3CB|nr:uncharacterized protein H6S33_012768 [Morchella sextelata]KAH0609282.1 hypothetical protein H6S33_012768 [Morchella sextelata]
MIQFGKRAGWNGAQYLTIDQPLSNYVSAVMVQARRQAIIGTSRPDILPTYIDLPTRLIMTVTQEQLNHMGSSYHELKQQAILRFFIFKMSQKTPRYVGFPPALEITYVGSSSLEMGPDSRPKENSGTRATIAGPIRVSIPSVSFLAVTNHSEIWGTTIFHTLTLAVVSGLEVNLFGELTDARGSWRGPAKRNND